jgi:hypothetical protein
VDWPLDPSSGRLELWKTRPFSHAVTKKIASLPNFVPGQALIILHILGRPAFLKKENVCFNLIQEIMPCLLIILNCDALLVVLLATVDLSHAFEAQ